ncbi:MAG: ROK family protein, partial [Microbacterium sp.]
MSAVRPLVLAVDLGGTKLEAALVCDDGALVAGSRVRRPTGPDLDAATLRRRLGEVVDAA